MFLMTAAHKTLPLGTWVTVTDLHTKRSVRVRINDRGPFVEGRIIDLSFGAARALGIEEVGTARVVIRCQYSEAMLNNELGHWVQLGAYSDLALAEEIADDLRGGGSKVKILTSGSLHRVRVGPFSSARKAYRTRDRFRDQGLNAYVIRDLIPLSPSPTQGRSNVLNQRAEVQPQNQRISP